VRWGGGTCRLGSLAVPALVELVQEREREREKERKKEFFGLLEWQHFFSHLLWMCKCMAWYGMVWYLSNHLL